MLYRLQAEEVRLLGCLVGRHTLCLRPAGELTIELAARSALLLQRLLLHLKRVLLRTLRLQCLLWVLHLLPLLLGDLPRKLHHRLLLLLLSHLLQLQLLLLLPHVLHVHLLLLILTLLLLLLLLLVPPRSRLCALLPARPARTACLLRGC